MSLFAQNTEMKGDGIVLIDIANFPLIEFYNSPDTAEPTETFKIFMDESINSFNIENLKQIRNDWFKPLHFNLEYFMFYLQCTEIENDWYQVIVNEQTNLKYWMRKSTILSYKSWENFICEKAIGIIPSNPEENPILKSPHLDSEKAEKQPIDCLMPVSISNEWLTVKVEPAICDQTNQMNEDEIFTGFIRWKKGNQLLIKYYLLL